MNNILFTCKCRSAVVVLFVVVVTVKWFHFNFFWWTQTSLISLFVSPFLTLSSYSFSLLLARVDDMPFISIKFMINQKQMKSVHLHWEMIIEHVNNSIRLVSLDYFYRVKIQKQMHSSTAKCTHTIKKSSAHSSHLSLSHLFRCVCINISVLHWNFIVTHVVIHTKHISLHTILSSQMHLAF